MTTNPKPLLILAPFLLLASCGDAGRDGTAGTRGSLDGPDVMLNAVTEDIFTVGSIVGDNWDTFGNVGSVAFDSSGNLHILDFQSEHILVVAPDGSLVRTVGGRGEGPGEFGNVSSAIVARDGSYTVLGSSRVDLLAPDGTFVRSVTLERGLILSDMTLPDGRLVASQFLRMADFMASGKFPDPEGRPIHLIPLDGSAPEIHYTAWVLPEDPAAGDADEDSDPGTIRLSAGRAFEPELHLDVLTDGRLALADSIGYRVKLIGLDGGVAGVIERPIAPLAVSEAIMQAERKRYREETRQLESVRSERFQIEREGAEALVFADEVPVIGNLKVDWDDRIWVTRSGTDGDDDGPVDIVTPDGHCLADSHLIGVIDVTGT